MEKKEFLKILKSICSAQTSADPDGWTSENPLWGHCANVSLLAQDIYGGTLVRGSLKDNSKYSYLKSHFWNRLPSGEEYDFTSEQYPDISFQQLPVEERTRERVLSHPDTVRRYELLKKYFNEKIKL